MDKNTRERILHIVKRLAEIERLFNSELDALYKEVEIITKEEKHGNSQGNT